MAERAASNMVSEVVSKLGDILSESTMAFEDVGRLVDRIGKELRRMKEFTEELEGSNPEQTEVDLIDNISDVALAAQEAIEIFVNKRKRSMRSGFFYLLLDKYRLGRDLARISDTMREISAKILIYDRKNIAVSVTVEVPGGGGSNIVAPAMEKLDHILTQNLIILHEETIMAVEHVRDNVLQNLVSISTPTGEREKVWLEEVKDLCDYTVAVAEKFIAKRQRRLWQVRYLFEQYASEKEFMKQMEYICTQFEDALYRRWTFGKDKGPKMGSRSRPVAFTKTTRFLLGPILEPLFLWRHLDQNLKTTRRYLAIMCALFSDIESAEGLILNERQKVWVEQLRAVAQKGHYLIAAYPRLDKFFFAEEINYLLNEIIDISDRKNIYGIANIQGERKESGPSSIQGREGEIIDQFDPLHFFPYPHTTELKREFQIIAGEKQLMDALFRDVQEIGDENLDARSKIWLAQKQDIAREIISLIRECASLLRYEPINLYARDMVLSQDAIMAHAIESIKQRRQKIRGASGSQVAYGLVQRQPRAESLSTFQILRRRTQPSLIVKESRVVGFKEDAEVLMGQLLSQEEGRCIISIVGIEGTGKKTLARLIFDDEAVEDHFSCRVFVSVSPSWTVEKLLDEIATQSEINIMGGQQDTLRILATTKYLIVLDGIQFRTSHFLDTLTEAIPDMSTGSRILLTTRNASIVAPHAAARSFVHHLQLLDDENSWILFKRSLIVDIPLPPKLIEVGKKIVAKCGGLPSEILRTTTLLSRRDVTDEGWKEQLKQPNPVENPWAETLGTNLPLYLKRCLFYLELFPANFGIPVRRLVVLWVAEGLVQHGKHQEAPEQVAERYLTELIDLNMLQVAKRKPNGKVKTCRLPNSLRDLLVIKANELRFPQVSTSTDLNPTNSRIRQVADRFDEKDIWHKHIHVSNRNDSASLRNYYKDVLSFLSFDAREGSKPGQDISKFLNLCIWSNCLLLLRVLDLEGVHKPELPENISKLTLLRYLGLRWTYLQSLPSSIGNLLKLQTIDLKHTYIHTLTSSIWKMELRHLFLSETYRTRFPSKPKSAGDSLSDLQTLWGLFVDEGTPVKGDLDKLVNIKRLGIACQSMSLDENAMNSQLDAVADWILKLEKLKSLRLKSRDEKGQPWNLHLNSLQNHTDLTDLYLLGRLSGPSILSRFPPNLSELTLSHSKLEDDPMQILKDLENLRSLSLLAESYLGERLFCNSQSFPKLHVLKVWNLEQLEEWKIEKEALPSLIQLEIRACSRMTKLPEGLPHVNTLLELKLTNMPKQIDVDQTLLNCDVQRDN